MDKSGFCNCHFLFVAAGRTLGAEQIPKWPNEKMRNEKMRNGKFSGTQTMSDFNPKKYSGSRDQLGRRCGHDNTYAARNPPPLPFST
ncbi:MAG TPA: hypothetical protein VF899_04455, partial [Pyrinomonadaceae bacterium]